MGATVAGWAVHHVVLYSIERAMGGLGQFCVPQRDATLQVDGASLENRVGDRFNAHLIVPGGSLGMPHWRHQLS
ncbi:hypothetical protein GCM10011415_05400 [Salipiger pallidus]|uniref:Uncharacterized protein n=1 Tax=Salipiger pallidus TaxID=1775170 RepID=A0A8J2ZH71_9RHOB|nr:hypothetical protein GCM10011415_05400 [Salipiger pallidus]